MTKGFPSWMTAMKSLTGEDPDQSSQRSVDSSVYSYGQSDDGSIQEVEVFGDVLRESLSTRKDEQRLLEDRNQKRKLVRIVLRRPRPPSLSPEPNPSILEEKEVNDRTYRNSTLFSIDETFREDLEESPSCFGRFSTAFCGYVISALLFCNLVVLIAEEGSHGQTDAENDSLGSLVKATNSSGVSSSARSWKWNMDCIGWCLVAMICFEALLVIALLISFLMHDSK